MVKAKMNFEAFVVDFGQEEEKNDVLNFNKKDYSKVEISFNRV